MRHVGIRDANGHRREVGFVAVQITASLDLSTETAEITITAGDAVLPPDRCCCGFASWRSRRCPTRAIAGKQNRRSVNCLCQFSGNRAEVHVLQGTLAAARYSGQ